MHIKVKVVGESGMNGNVPAMDKYSLCVGRSEASANKIAAMRGEGSCHPRCNECARCD